MHYVIQKNVFREPNYDKIFETLEKLKLPYEIVEFGPDGDFSFETERKDIFVFGSVRLARIAMKHDWMPGSLLNVNHDYSIYSNYYKDNLLNYDSIIQKFGDTIIWEPNEIKFIRPTKDSKAFTGQLFTETKWNDKVELVRNKEDKSTILDFDTPIQIATSKKIYKEARTWIVDKKVVASSYYKFGDYVEYSEDVEPEGLEFAQEMAKLYQVADAFVLDICLTPDGWKIVEINCINMSGFYRGDLQRIVMALENFYNPIPVVDKITNDVFKNIFDKIGKKHNNEIATGISILKYDLINQFIRIDFNVKSNQYTLSGSYVKIEGDDIQTYICEPWENNGMALELKEEISQFLKK